jgi:hypothetical protein
MARDPREARTLGLWTAAWLGVLLLVLLIWLGDLAVQWPALLVPAVWALVAARPRRAARTRPAVGYRTDTVERPALRPPDQWG